MKKKDNAMNKSDLLTDPIINGNYFVYEFAECVYSILPKINRLIVEHCKH